MFATFDTVSACAVLSWAGRGELSGHRDTTALCAETTQTLPSVNTNGY